MEEKDTCIKINLQNSTKYKPKHMTDDSVFNMAQHYYTLEEIAEFFNVSAETVNAHHGEAFREGKHQAKQKPRMMLNRMFDEIMSQDSIAKPIILDDGKGGTKVVMPDLSGIKGLLEFHAKKYEGLGSKQTIVHEGHMQYDAVESKPLIIERPE